MYLLELDDIELDVVLAAAVNLKLDTMDCCISQLEVKEAVKKAEVMSVYFFPSFPVNSI